MPSSRGRSMLEQRGLLEGRIPRGRVLGDPTSWGTRLSRGEGLTPHPLPARFGSSKQLRGSAGGGGVDRQTILALLAVGSARRRQLG